MILQMEQMDLERAQGSNPDTTILRLTGPFTLATMFPFQAVLREPDLKSVVIDLSGVPYMDSAGLGVLLGHWSHTKRGGFKFALVGISPRVMTIFEITHTNSILPMFDTAADAEAAFAN